MKRHLQRAAALAALFSSTALIADPSPEEILATASRYTVKVQTLNHLGFNQDEGGSLDGTGFLIDRKRGWILTNAHVATRSPSEITVSFIPVIHCEKTTRKNMIASLRRSHGTAINAVLVLIFLTHTMPWLCVRSVPTVRLLGYAFERLVAALYLHQMASMLVALLPMPVRTLKLRPTRYRAATEAIACILRHAVPILSRTRLERHGISILFYKDMFATSG